MDRQFVTNLVTNNSNPRTRRWLFINSQLPSPNAHNHTRHSYIFTNTKDPSSIINSFLLRHSKTSYIIDAYCVCMPDVTGNWTSSPPYNLPFKTLMLYKHSVPRFNADKSLPWAIHKVLWNIREEKAESEGLAVM